ncbi:MAG TPA: hypothetical protein VGE76_21780 [Opitutaceae bacterium]
MRALLVVLIASGPVVATAADAASSAAPVVDRAWELTGNFRTAVGFKENVLLSAIHADDSAFTRNEAEIFWWLLPTERFEALAFANVAHTRFHDSTENPRELQAFAHGEARWYATPTVQATAIVEGYQLDQVFDLSASSAERVTEQLSVTGGLVSTVFRWDFLPRTWLELKPTAQRDRYRDGSDDNNQQSGRATLGRSWRDGRIELTLAGQLLQRNYLYRPRFTAGGRPLFGTDLDFEQREGELNLTVIWDKARHWSTVTAAIAGDNRDNGERYFDYRRRSLRQELVWKNKPWRVRLVGRATRYDYDTQEADIGINPPKRLKEEYLAQLRIERRLTERALLFADYLWERSRANVPLTSYTVKTALAGLDWSF